MLLFTCFLQYSSVKGPTDYISLVLKEQVVGTQAEWDIWTVRDFGEKM